MHQNGYGDKGIVVNQANNHKDTIQVIAVSDNSTGIFATGGWDGNVKVWRILQTNHPKVEIVTDFSFEDIVISLQFNNDNLLFVGLANGDLNCVQYRNSKKVIKIDSFSPSSVLYLKWIKQLEILISFSSDKTMKCFKIQNNQFVNHPIVLPQRTCCVDIQFPYMAICSLYRYRVYRIDNNNIVTNDYTHYFDTLFQAKTKITCCAISSSFNTLFLGSFDSNIASIPFSNNTNIQANIRVFNIAVKSAYSPKIILKQVNAMKFITMNDSTKAILIGHDKRIMIYSSQNLKQIKSFNTKSSNQITAMNIINFQNKNYLISGTGNDWAQGLNSLSKQIKTDLQVRQIREIDLK